MPPASLESINEPRGLGSRPARPCVVIQVRELTSEHATRALVADVRQALTGGAPAVAVLCAAGTKLLRAREQLRDLDRVLAPLAQTLSARVSRSATDGLAAWAASLVTPVGVDVQSAPASLETEVMHAALHPEEAAWLAGQHRPELAFAALWSGKEAVLKAFGVGLAWSPREVLAAPVTAAWRALQVGTLGHAWLSHLQVDVVPSVALAVALNAGQVAPD